MAHPSPLPLSHKLSGLDPPDEQKLAADGITTLSALRTGGSVVVKQGFAVAAAGKDGGALWRALALLELRAAAGKMDAPAMRAWTFIRANWMEGFLLVFALLLASLSLRAVLLPERMMVARRDLSPFEVIDSAAVEQKRPWGADFGTFAKSDDVVGRFPLRAIPSGEVLRTEQLSRVRYQPATELNGRRILSLPLARRSLRLAVAGTHAGLLLSPRSADAQAVPALINDVVVLNAEAGDSASVVLAVLENDMPAVERLLATSEVYLVQKQAAPATSPPALPAAPPSALPDNPR